ncbi:alpha/beta fold hydrolase [Streptomyces alkaliterrae]|uniref:Alpha/beta fold hydrolase n=1 Tax=Streptomyces alkaliterrae TaxID=2213162 RepID=A0A5P0YZM5_9ACTN|nr:alpha/beta hydrolase [Streptomyces alkaliterrae]MBB1255528.1 alpha/beta hydrolase [Streptomyces alkaliterrae]MBB1261350.1 alpha/beta hydrolase [Streptomyces alkaliterrae]MQS05182.1 alpha/beta fold hydrolase [Streptomyces alkaliterrae]
MRASGATSCYRNPAARAAVADWCADRLARWPVPHRTTLLDTAAGPTHVTTAGDGPRDVVLLPGTNFNAATCLPLATALAARLRVHVVDLPGQPGLSSPARPPRAVLGRWLAEVLTATVERPAVVLGYSLGALPALLCDAPPLAGRVLLAPAGLVRLRVTPRVLAATLPWLLRPTDRRSAALLDVMSGPGRRPPAELAEWMTLVSRSCRSTMAPAPLPDDALASPSLLRGGSPSARRPTLLLTGSHDVFLPTARLRDRAVSQLGADVHELTGVGHLAAEEAPETVADLAAGFAEST